jgi:phosphatidylglycerol:prolipoprotein diacylglycerol transferase
VQPEIDLGPITLQTFGIMFALGFVSAGVLVGKRLVELGKPVDWAYEVIFSALAGGFIGARIYYMVQNWDLVQDDFFGSLFSGEGLVWYGGAIGGAVAVLLWARYRDFVSLALLDLCAPALAIGYAVGRIGCQLSGDGDYGKPSDLPWAMSYPDGTVPTTQEVHPTPVYETLTMGLVAFVLWRLRNRFRAGMLFAVYLVLSGAERFLVEFIRRNDDVFAGLTVPQLESLALMVIGSVWLVLATWGSRRPGEPASPGSQKTPQPSPGAS